MTDTLKIESLYAGYGAITVLRGADLRVPEGTLTCLLGPNGAGKTTLCRAVAGSLGIDGGSIRFRDRDISRWSPERRARHGIVLVPQGRRVFPELTVEENLDVARFAAGRRVAASRRRTEVYELFPRLVDLGGRLAGTLSGGEQQMLALARALMAGPELLILDEPSLGLAPAMVARLYDAIHRIRETGVALLLIEQAVEAALTVADAVALLDNGTIVGFDTTDRSQLDRERMLHAYLGSNGTNTRQNRNTEGEDHA